MAGKVKVGIIGSQFEADIHAASFQHHARGSRGRRRRLAHARERRGAREEVRHPARLPPTTGRCSPSPTSRWSPSPRPTAALPDDHRRRQRRQARRLREAAVHDAGRGRRDDRRLPPAGRAPDVRRGALLHAEIRQGQARWPTRAPSASVHLVKQSEKHSGPHGDWFWDVEQSGGGVFMDMGCHGIAFCYWFLGRPAHQGRLLPDGHPGPRRQDPGRRRVPLHPRVRGRRGRAGRG